MKYGVIKTIWDNPIMQKVGEMSKDPTESTPNDIYKIGREFLLSGILNTNYNNKDINRVLKIYEAIERISSDTRRTLDQQALNQPVKGH